MITPEIGLNETVVSGIIVQVYKLHGQYRTTFIIITISYYLKPDYLIYTLSVLIQVRVRLSITAAKTMDVCLQFPPDFPNEVVISELKSKTLPDKFLKCVEQLVDSQKSKILATTSGQIVEVLRIVSDYFEANPLCVCVQEVSDAKKLLNTDSDSHKSFKASLRFILQSNFIMGRAPPPTKVTTTKFFL